MQSGSRILVIKLGALGDVVLASAHIRRIVEAYPHGRVTLLTSPACGALLQGQPDLDVVTFRRRGVAESWRLFGWLRRQRFSVVFDLQGSRRSRIMTWLSGASRRVGETPCFAYTHAVASRGDAVHGFERLNALLASQRIDPADPRGWVPVNAMARDAVQAWLDEHAPGSARLVLLHAGSSARWRSKRWDAAYFAELAAGLERRGCRVIWIGSDDDAAVNRQLTGYAGVDATGAFSLVQLAALGTRAAFAVTGDSAPMHLLGAAGLPVYALFGPTDWRRSHVPGQAQHVLYHAVDCSPCFLPVCPAGRGHACLRGITPAMVIERLEQDGRIQGSPN